MQNINKKIIPQKSSKQNKAVCIPQLFICHRASEKAHINVQFLCVAFLKKSQNIFLKWTVCQFLFWCYLENIAIVQWSTLYMNNSYIELLKFNLKIFNLKEIKRAFNLKKMCVSFILHKSYLLHKTLQISESKQQDFVFILGTE